MVALQLAMRNPWDLSWVISVGRWSLCCQYILFSCSYCKYDSTFLLCFENLNCMYCSCAKISTVFATDAWHVFWWQTYFYVLVLFLMFIFCKGLFCHFQGYTKGTNGCIPCIYILKTLQKRVWKHIELSGWGINWHKNNQEGSVYINDFRRRLRR